MKKALFIAVVILLTGCASSLRQGEMRQYVCSDGTAFSLEVSDYWVRLRTVTGPIELRRTRHDEYRNYFTNGLRDVVLDDAGRARHRVGQRDWTDCDWSG